MLVANAANVATDHAWITDQVKTLGDVAIVDSSSRYALIAVQGPAALETLLQPLTGADLASVPYYGFTYGEVAYARALISRTGYTGEDGFEIFVPPNTADRVWQALLESGSAAGVVPCGLGARDTLRLEAGMRLYGHDIDDTTTPVEAGLGWIVGWNKTAASSGADRARAQQKADGPARKLVGLRADGPRHRPARLHRGARTARRSGVVTSGTQTPFLKKAIGMAYVPAALAAAARPFEIDIRGRMTPAVVVPLPFYKRAVVHSAGPIRPGRGPDTEEPWRIQLTCATRKTTNGCE